MYRLTMVKQISLDAWSLQHLTDLLKKGSQIVAKTNTPIVLYRQTMEEEDGSYEEIVCTLTNDYVIEQLIINFLLGMLLCYFLFQIDLNRSLEFQNLQLLKLEI